MSPRSSSSAAHGHAPAPGDSRQNRRDPRACAWLRPSMLLLPVVLICGAIHAEQASSSIIPAALPGQSGLAPDPSSNLEMQEVMGSAGLSGQAPAGGFPDLADDEAGRTAEKAWTLMFYDDADFYGAYDPFDDFCSEAASSPALSVVILRDMEDGPSTLWYVSSAHEAILLEELGEVNMGSGETLSDFILWAKQHYPAGRYMMTIYDHGGGWMSACQDKASGGDLLTMDEMHLAISGNGGLDILCFTAPCLMGALESVYELRDCVDVYIGSENMSGYTFWFDNIVDVCAVLDSQEWLSNQEIAEIIVEAVGENPTPEYEEYMTMSATLPGASGEVVAHIDELASYMTAHIDELGGRIEAARTSAWEMGNVFTYDCNEIDLIDFLVLYYAMETDPFVLEKIGEILSSFYQVLICEVHGSGQNRSHGLSISFPEDRASYQKPYSNVDLDFADDTSWDEFLDAFYHFQETGIAEGSGTDVPRMCITPNPFSSTATVWFSCPSAGLVTVRVHDCAGRIVAVLFSGSLESGGHELVWDGTAADGEPLPSGIYICTLASGSLSAKAEMLILR